MKRKKPVELKVEFDDGTMRTLDYDVLTAEAKRHLISAGLLEIVEVLENDDKRYVLVEWDNGWKEVFGVPEYVTDVRRYYVISRTEEVGRVFLECKDNFPELIEIFRNPKKVERVTLL